MHFGAILYLAYVCSASMLANIKCYTNVFLHKH